MWILLPLGEVAQGEIQTEVLEASGSCETKPPLGNFVR